MSSPTPAHRPLAEVVEIVYREHGCSCDEHPSTGASASCRAWRRRAAERVAAALRPVEEGGMELKSCRCGALIPADLHLCWDCALASANKASTSSNAEISTATSTPSAPREKTK